MGLRRPAHAARAAAARPASRLSAWLPGLATARAYDRRWLRGDIVAGVILTALLVPAGMGYAEASGLPAITGLYATVVPLLAYALFGPSHILVLGPGLRARGAHRRDDPPEGRRRPDAGGRARRRPRPHDGALCIAAGLASLGFITDLLSKPVRVGYLNGIALTVIVSQLPKLFGFSVDADGSSSGSSSSCGVVAGETEPAALAIGVGMPRDHPRPQAVRPARPGRPHRGDRRDGRRLGPRPRDTISVVGAVPRGLPFPSIPSCPLADLPALFIGAWASRSSRSRTRASSRARSRGAWAYRVDPNRELVGARHRNLAGGFFRGFPVSSSASRTPVAESAGARTQLTGIVGALAIVGLLVAAPGLLRICRRRRSPPLSSPPLLGLIDVASSSAMRACGAPIFVSIVASSPSPRLGVLTGIALAVAVSLLDFVRRRGGRTTRSSAGPRA